MSFFWKNKHSPSNSAPTNRLVSQSQASQQPPQSRQQTQQPQPLYPWSAHTAPSVQSRSLFPRSFHALSTTATAVGELFLFGGRTPDRISNDVYRISTRDFSTTLLQTSGDVPNPRYGHCAVLTSTILLIWGGTTGSTDQNDDDSFYLLNLFKPDLFMSRPTPADQSFFRSSIARVVLHRDQWSRARPSLLPYHDVGRFQALRFRWRDRQGVFK